MVISDGLDCVEGKPNGFLFSNGHYARLSVKSLVPLAVSAYQITPIALEGIIIFGSSRHSEAQESNVQGRCGPK